MQKKGDHTNKWQIITDKDTDEHRQARRQTES